MIEGNNTISTEREAEIEDEDVVTVRSSRGTGNKFGGDPTKKVYYFGMLRVSEGGRSLGLLMCGQASVWAVVGF